MECLNTEPKREAEGRRRGGVEPGSYKPIDLGPIHGKTLQIFTCKHPRRSILFKFLIEQHTLDHFFLRMLSSLHYCDSTFSRFSPSSGAASQSLLLTCLSLPVYPLDIDIS